MPGPWMFYYRLNTTEAMHMGAGGAFLSFLIWSVTRDLGIRIRIGETLTRMSRNGLPD